MRKNLTFSAALVVSLSFGAIAANHHEDTKKACSAEIKKICPKDEKYRACLEENMSKFSEQCKRATEKRVARMDKWASCKADKQKYCADAKGHRKMKKCLHQNKQKLSASCKQLVEESVKKGKHKNKK